jgi:hypothetical protein
MAKTTHETKDTRNHAKHQSENKRVIPHAEPGTDPVNTKSRPKGRPGYAYPVD